MRLKHGISVSTAQRFVRKRPKVLSEIALATGDKDYMKQCVLSENLDSLTQNQIKNMIKRIGDDNFTLQCIEDGMLKDNGIKQDLLQGINDVNVIKKAINDNINYINIDTEACL